MSQVPIFNSSKHRFQKTEEGNAGELFDIVVADKQERLEKVAHVFREADIDVKVEILFGKSFEEIARAALTEQADLVIRYMKGHRSRQAGTFGTTAFEKRLSLTDDGVAKDAK